MSRHALLIAAVVSLLAGIASDMQAQDTRTIRLDSTTYFYGELCYVASLWEDATLDHLEFFAEANDTVYSRGYQNPGGSPQIRNYIMTPNQPTLGTYWWNPYWGGGGDCWVTVVNYENQSAPAGIFPCYSYEFTESTSGAYRGQMALSEDMGLIGWIQPDANDSAWVLDEYEIEGGSGMFPLAIGNEWIYIEGYPAGIKEKNEFVPNTFLFHQNHPNPFNPSTVLSFELRAASFVTLEVFNGAGSWITTLEEGWKTAGVHEVIFDGSGLPSGMYLARLQAGEQVIVNKMVLHK